MNTGAAIQNIDDPDPWEGLTVRQANRTEPLSECVRRALRFYLQNLGDYDTHDLYDIVMKEVESPLIETVLEHTQGNQTKAASMLGMSRSTLRKKMANHAIGRGN